MSVGLGGKIDGADQGDKANGETRKDGGEENACKAFSKDLGLYDKSVLKILVTR